MIRIKICGITTLADGLSAIEAGADMLGFNFYLPSSRYIEPQACARIIADLHGRQTRVTTVGVFVNTPAQVIATILAECDLDLAQLHGDEPASDLVALGDRAFKAIRPPNLNAARVALARYPHRSAAPALLVDAASGRSYGGTGQTGDWALAATLATEYPLLLAGGLDPENVATAVTQVQPWGVDVASGVESTPGRKDPAKMMAFVQAARRALDDVQSRSAAGREK